MQVSHEWYFVVVLVLFIDTLSASQDVSHCVAAFPSVDALDRQRQVYTDWSTLNLCTSHRVRLADSSASCTAYIQPIVARECTITVKSSRGSLVLDKIEPEDPATVKPLGTVFLGDRFKRRHWWGKKDIRSSEMTGCIRMTLYGVMSVPAAVRK